MTRKLILLALVMMLGSGIMLSAQQSGFTGPGLQTITVQEAKTLRDNTPVQLRGNIIQFLGNERYLFSDSTGTIIVEIDNDLWRNLTVNENDLVEIFGEVDRVFRGVEIEVDSIRKL